MGAPFKPFFGLSGTPPRWTGSFLYCNGSLHPVQSAFEVRGTLLKPKNGLNGAPIICQ